MCSSKKGISALQLQRELSLGSYRTAWFMAHRVRHAMDHGPLHDKLKGVVEVDETYVGGKSKQMGRPGPNSKKTPVVGLVQRDGNMMAHPVERVNSKTLKGEIRKYVDPDSTIMTDSNLAYHGIGSEFAGGHHTVNHTIKEYSRGPVHVNTAESFFGMLKRGHYGVFHSMSKQHLHRYCSEFVFRWNLRKVSDSERTESALKQVEGKRLVYRRRQAD